VRSCSAEFKALWQQKVGARERRRIRYRRLYYNGSAYVYETAENYLYEGDFVGWGVIPGELDSPQQNVYRMGVVTVRLDNSRNQWVESDGTPSFFAADAVASSGYKLYKTELQLQVGLRLNSTGEVEWVTQFTGYVLGAKLSTQSGVAEIRLASKSALRLEKSDAADVSIPFTLENCSPATGTGALLNFKSTSTGVSKIDAFVVNGSAYAKTDYVVGNLNKVDSPDNDGKATITVSDAGGLAPGSGHTVKVSGRKSYQSQGIDTLLGLVADNAGLSADERSIAPIVLPVAASASEQIDSQAEWLAYLAQANVAFNASAGSIHRKWWLINDFGVDDAGSGLYYISGGKLHVTNSGGTSGSYQSLNPTLDTSPERAWEFKFRMVGGGEFRFRDFAWFREESGLFVDYVLFYDGANIGIKHFGGSPSTLGTAAESFATEKTIRVTVTDSTIKVYVDTVQKISVAASPAAASTKPSFGLLSGSGSDCIIDDFYVALEADGVTAATDALAYAEYQFDLGSTPSALGILAALQDLNGGAITLKTATAPDSAGSPGTYDAYVVVDSNGQMQSTPRQWLKIKAEFTPSGYTSPVLHRLIANYSTTSITVSLAILDGLTGAQVFERYAALVDYETGDDADGKRYLRSKDPSPTVAVELDHDSGVIEVLEFDPGHDDVATVARVRFGDFIEEYDGADAGETSPTPEDLYGRVPAELDLTGVLLAGDVNLAAARAELLYNRLSRPKKKIRLLIWAVPWLEVGDRITLTVLDQPLLTRPAANDPLPRATGSLSFSAAPGNVLANQTPMKVLQYKPDYDTNVAELYAEEILTT
jgi:hypothetical protein